MKLTAIITTLMFAGALFAGPTLAADRGAVTDDPARNGGYTDELSPGDRGGALEPRPGTPMAEPGQDRQDEFFQAEEPADRIAGKHRANNLMGKSVVSQQGNDLGSIDDLVISENGQVEFIILSRGGTLGIGGDMVPVPWEAANLQMGADDQFTAEITEEQLENAPTFEDYAQIGSQEYEQEVHSYFGTEPRAGRVFPQ